MGHQPATQTRAAKAARQKRAVVSTDPARSTGALAHLILQLQQTIGNQAVGHLIQAKLRIGQPGDQYEREADRVADQVMRMPDPRLQSQVEPGEKEENGTSQAQSPTSQLAPLVQRRIGPEEEEEEQETLQARAPTGQTMPLVHKQIGPEEQEEEEKETIRARQAPGRSPAVTFNATARVQSFRGGGKPLPESIRAFFEPRFGCDFTQVRIHKDTQAAGVARAVRARALTVGRDIVFGAGEFAPGTAAGQRLLAHELTHVMQQAGPRSRMTPMIQRLPEDGATASQKKCTSSIAADKVIRDHRVEPDIIKKPGDKVKITVIFACKVRSWNSTIEGADGTSLDLRKPVTKTTDKFERKWDGKKFFKDIGTFLVDDGEYRHRLDKVLYAYKYNRRTRKAENLYAGESKLISPTIKVKAREFKEPGGDHFHFTSENVKLLAKIIESEIGEGNDTEKRAIAWAVRNQMIRIGTSKVEEARKSFNDAAGKSAMAGSKTIAEKILKISMSDDITSGAIKWFSPKRMPKGGESCKGFDCSGGLITVTDDKGSKRKVHAPGFHKTMSYIPVAGVREWLLRFYSLG